MNYPKIALLVLLGLTATACGNNKTPNALSPSVNPSAPAPTTPSISSPETTLPTGISTPATTVNPLPGAPPLVPATIPNSGINSPVGSAGNIQNGANDNPPPKRKRVRRVKKATPPSPEVTYSDTPVKGKPESKPTKPVKKQQRDDVSDEGVEEKPTKKLPTKPTKKPKDSGDEDAAEKEPAAKPAKPAKAEVDGAEGGKKPKGPDNDNKKQDN
jgi:hypothetical protein